MLDRLGTGARHDQIEKFRTIINSLNFVQTGVEHRKIFESIAREFLDLYLNDEELITVDEIDTILGLGAETVQGKGDTYFLDRKYCVPTLVDAMRSNGESVHSFVTKELVMGLGNRIIEKALDSGQAVFVVVEVGAGNGRLAHCLKRYLKEKSPSGIEIKYIAIDPAHESSKRHTEIEPLNDLEAINQYSPDILLMSYMPAYTDLTAAWRTSENLKEYILIGNASPSISGTEETWGYTDYVPPFTKDGFEKEALDIRTIGFWYNEDSVTSFKRKNPVEAVLAGTREKTEAI